MIGGFYVTHSSLFYINSHGDLICRDPLAFEFNGSEKIIREYRRSVVHWNNHYRGKTSNPTTLPDQTITSPFSTINSKAAGRLLAAGGIYNDNSQMFADTARKLGGETAKGFDEILNKNTINALSIASVLLTGAKRGISKFGTYRPTRALPRDKYGNPVPDTDVPHTQLGTRTGRKEVYTQAREWGYDSKKMKKENGHMFSEDREKTTLAELLAKMPENNWNWYLYDFEGTGIAPEGMDMQTFENLVVTQTCGYPFCWLSLKAFCSTLTDVKSCLLAAVKHPVDYELLESKEGSDVLALIKIDDSTEWEIKLSEVL